jgi:chromosome segregation ATPase
LSNFSADQQLEKASQDPELPDIPIKIKSLQNKIDQVNREIQEDQEALRSLRQECDTQNEISILRQQIQRDVDALHEFIQSHSSSFARFNVQVPNPLPGKEDDPDGDLFVNTMGTVANAFREKFDVATSAWEKASGDADNKQQFVSEKSALLSHNREVLASLRQKLDALSKEDSNVTKFEREVASLKKFEVSAGVVANFDDKDPSKVVAYLTSRIEAVEASASASEAVPPEMLARVIDQLTEVANYRNPETGEVEDQLCPCCRRSFEDVAAARQFKKSMAQLKSSQSVLLQTDKEKVEKDRTAIANYQRWRKTVSECMGDVLNYTRMEGEANDLEKTVADDEKELATAEKELQDLNNNSADLKKELEELRGLADISKRWNDDASRIATSKGQVRMKEDFSVNMSMSTTLSGGRDLRTVEADLERHQAQKDKLNDQVTVINKRQTELTQRLNMFSQQARKCEEQAREKEKQYEQEQSSSKRKEELTGELERLGQEEAKVSNCCRSGRDDDEQ